MKSLDNNSLQGITGGSALTGIAIAAVVIFLSGVLEGFTNPGRCSD